MPTSVRLDRQTEEKLERMARSTGRTKSDLIRDAIVRLDEELNGDEGPTLYEQLRDYIGIMNIGPGDRARRSEEVLREEGFGLTRQQRLDLERKRR